MDKRLFKFLLGFTFGTMIFSVMVHVSGSLLDGMGNVLHDSDQEQQRNFIMVMSGWLLTSILVGFIAMRVKKRTTLK